MKRSGWQRLLLAGALGCGLLACNDLGAVEDGDDDDDVIEGVSCMAELMVTGTLAPPGTPPGPEEGCIPLGTWTIDVQLIDQGDCEEVPFQPQYVWEASGNTDDGYTYTYPADPTNPWYFMKVTQSGPGDCNANIEHYGPDGMSLLLLRPFERDLSLSGIATYETYEEPAIDLPE